jgi:hypothetical protein
MIITCDRCGLERRLEYEDVLHPKAIKALQTEWAIEWSAAVAPYGECLYSGQSDRHVCDACLTEAEREQITVQRATLL